MGYVFSLSGNVAYADDCQSLAKIFANDPKNMGDNDLSNLRQFADLLTGIPIYRVVDDEDMVTTLPSERILDMSAGFVHAGEHNQLTGKPSKLGLFDPPKPLADHAPTNYVERL